MHLTKLHRIVSLIVIAAAGLAFAKGGQPTSPRKKSSK